jgi:photosynthetic reaction center H subunit
MTYGAITAHFDVAQITIYVFWGFFFSLIWYLRREDHREGYPLVADFPGTEALSIPPLPTPKVFVLGDGTEVFAPRAEAPEVFAAEQVLPWPGAPFEPTGNPMVDGVGPAAYANRADVPDHHYDDGLPKIVPLRSAADYFLAYEDTDPRGFAVIGNDGVQAGEISDVWIDRSEYVMRYFEVALAPEFGGGSVLLPTSFAKIKAKQRVILCNFISSAHFAAVPALRHPDTVTFLEEDKICGYYAGGQLYGKIGRLEPIL